jgi:small membrane protein
MKLFQIVVLALFAVLAALTLSAGIRGTVRKRIVVFWLSIWGLGSVAIIWPHSTALLARALGIGRGADLLLYSSVLVMIVAFFYVYTRFKRVERQLTLLVRRLAIQNAAVPTDPRAANHDLRS